MNFNIEALTNPLPPQLSNPRISSHHTTTSKIRICLLEPSQSQESQLWDIPQSTSQLTYKTTTSPFKCLPTFLIQHATFLFLRSSNQTLKIPDQFSCVNRFFWGAVYGSICFCCCLVRRRLWWLVEVVVVVVVVVVREIIIMIIIFSLWQAKKSNSALDTW